MNGGQKESPKVVAMNNHIIENVLSPSGLTVLIGASGSGKTTFALQCFEAAAIEAIAFGLFPTQKLQPVYYASLDRRSDELEAKFSSINVPSELFKYKSYRKYLRRKDIMTMIYSDIPDGTKVIVLDGVGFLVEKVISQFHVGQVVSLIDDLSEQRNVIPMVLHHTPKVKGVEGYQDPREKGLGSGAWCQMAAHSIVFEKVAPGDVKNPYRRVWVLKSDGEDNEYSFKLTNRLEYLPDGLPAIEIAKTWTISEIMMRYSCGVNRAKEIWKEIQKGTPPDDIY